MSDTSKTAKIIKRWYYSTAHWQLGDVMVSDITFLWFLLFSMCHSLHVAVNKCINWCFVHLSHVTASVTQGQGQQLDCTGIVGRDAQSSSGGSRGRGHISTLYSTALPVLPAPRGRSIRGTLQTTTTRSAHDSAATSVARRAHSSHIDLRECIRVATRSVLTLNGTGYQTALVQELEKYNIAIAGLTEARLQDSDLSTVDGATFLHFGGHDRTQGVALVLRHPFNDALVTWQPTLLTLAFC